MWIITEAISNAEGNEPLTYYIIKISSVMKHLWINIQVQIPEPKEMFNINQ